MTVQIGLKVKPAGRGVWFGEMGQDDLLKLGAPVQAKGGRTILGVVQPRFIDDHLFFDWASVSVLNAGASGEILIIDLFVSRSRDTDQERNEARKATRTGDQQFIAECTNLLPPQVASLAEQLLRSVRLVLSGDMREGKARKWVNAPKNCLAITIQNRDQSLAIHVKGRPERHPEAKLVLKADRPGYSRFKISRLSDLQPAIDIIKRSAQL